MQQRAQLLEQWPRKETMQDGVADAAAPRILIADADDVLCRLLAVLCRHHGYRCEVAGDGTEALSKMETSAFDLLVLDTMMPTVNGFEVLARLHALQRRPAVILMSALPVALKLATLPGGELVHSVMEKSYGVDSLIALIADALAARA